MLVLTVGVVFIGVTGVKIAQNGTSRPQSWSYTDRCTTGSSMRHVDFLITVASLSLWAFLLVACVLGYVRFCCHLRPQPVGY